MTWLLFFFACSPSTPGAGAGPNSVTARHTGCTPGEQLWAFDVSASFGDDIEFSPDGRFVNVVEATGALDVLGGQPSEEHSWGAPMAFSPDGHLAAAGFGAYEVSLAARDDPYTSLASFPSPGGQIRDLAWSWNGQRLLIGADDGASVYDMSTRELLSTVSGTLPNIVSDVSITDDGATALLVGNDLTVSVVDVETGAVTTNYGGHIGESWGGELSRDGTFAVTTSIAQNAHTWDPATGEQIGGLDRVGEVLRDAAFTPTADAYVVGGANGYIEAMRTSDDSSLLTAQTVNEVWLVKVAPGGNTFATAEWPHDRSGPGRVKLWCLGAR